MKRGENGARGNEKREGSKSRDLPPSTKWGLDALGSGIECLIEH